MADEPRYSDEIRIPFSMTLPWSGKLTANGGFWPQDAKGRDWPAGRDGEPEFPIDLLPKGFAPGTSEIYEPGDGRRVTERFAASDAAMWDEVRRARAAVRVGGDRASGTAGQSSPIQQVAEVGSEEEKAEEKQEEEYEEKLARPRMPLSTSRVTGAPSDSTPPGDLVRIPRLGGAAILREDEPALSALNHPGAPVPSEEGAPASGARSAAAGETAVSALAAVRLKNQLSAQEIAGGHAFDKHVLGTGNPQGAAEFSGLSIRTRQQFAGLLEELMNNPTQSGPLLQGREYFFDSLTGTLVIRNPGAPDGGTAFRPIDAAKTLKNLR